MFKRKKKIEQVTDTATTEAAKTTVTNYTTTEFKYNDNISVTAREGSLSGVEIRQYHSGLYSHSAIITFSNKEELKKFCLAMLEKL